MKKFESVTNNLGRLLSLSRQDIYVENKYIVIVHKDDDPNEALEIAIDQFKELLYFKQSEILLLNHKEALWLRKLFCYGDQPKVMPEPCLTLSQKLREFALSVFQQSNGKFNSQALAVWLLDAELDKSDMDILKNFIVEQNPELGLIIANDPDQVSEYFKGVQRQIKKTDIIKFSNYNELFFKSHQLPAVKWIDSKGFKLQTKFFSYIL